MLLLWLLLLGSPTRAARRWDPFDPASNLHRYTPAAHTEFFAWLSSLNRSHVGPLRLAADASGAGLRVLAARDVAAGETLLAVPEEAGIGPRGGWDHAVLGPHLRAAFAAAVTGRDVPGSPAAAVLAADGGELAFLFTAWVHYLVFV